MARPQKKKKKKKKNPVLWADEPSGRDIFFFKYFFPLSGGKNDSSKKQ